MIKRIITLALIFNSVSIFAYSSAHCLGLTKHDSFPLTWQCCGFSYTGGTYWAGYYAQDSTGEGFIKNCGQFGGVNKTDCHTDMPIQNGAGGYDNGFNPNIVCSLYNTQAQYSNATK